MNGKPLWTALFLLAIALGTQATTINFSAYDDWTDNLQGKFIYALGEPSAPPIGQLYWQNGTDVAGYLNNTWATTLWRHGTVLTAWQKNTTDYTLQGASNIASWPAITFRSFVDATDLTVTMRLRCAVGLNGCTAGNGIEFALITYWGANGTNKTQYLNHTYNNNSDVYQNFTISGISLTAGESIRLIVGARGEASNDQFQVAGYQITGNVSRNITFGRTVIAAYDAVSLGRIYFNVQMSNGTNTTTFGNNYWLNKSFLETPIGNVTLLFSNSSYFPITLAKSFDASNDSVFNAYLLPTSNYTVHLTQLIVRDVIGSGIQGATVTVQQLIGSAYTTIGVQTTDSAGQTAFYLDSVTQYQFIISAAGYDTQINLLVPSGSQYTFTMDGTFVGGYFDAYNDTTFNILPAWFLNYPYFSVNVTVTSVGLSYYGFNGTLANTTQLFFTNSTDSSGGTLQSGQINRTNWNGTLYVTLFYKKDGANEFQFLKTYAFSNYSDTNSSLTGIIANVRAANFSPTLKIIVAGFISLIFAVGLGTLGSIGLGGTGVAFIIAFAFCSLVLDFVEPSLFYVITLLALAIYVIKAKIS